MERHLRFRQFDRLSAIYSFPATFIITRVIFRARDSAGGFGTRTHGESRMCASRCVDEEHLHFALSARESSRSSRRTWPRLALPTMRISILDEH